MFYILYYNYGLVLAVGSVGGSLPSPAAYLAGASAGVYALIGRAALRTNIFLYKKTFFHFCLTFLNILSQLLIASVRPIASLFVSPA
jgi:hypothetical protein